MTFTKQLLKTTEKIDDKNPLCIAEGFFCLHTANIAGKIVHDKRSRPQKIMVEYYDLISVFLICYVVVLLDKFF